MEKPLEVKIAETESSIIHIINNCGLPSCIVLPIMDNLTGEVRQQAAADRRNAIEAYQQSLENEIPSEELKDGTEANME
ncbi:MAG: hypothetical protein PUB17_09505 [Lachnospiraceae bacterium]|nr:hypothetical protein [Lachnospiraceae bacterium]